MKVEITHQVKIIESGVNEKNTNPLYTAYLEGSTRNYQEENFEVGQNNFNVNHVVVKNFEIENDDSNWVIDNIFDLLDWGSEDNKFIAIYAYDNTETADNCEANPVPFQFRFWSDSLSWNDGEYFESALLNLSHITVWPSTLPKLAIRLTVADDDKTVLLKVITGSNKTFTS